MPRLRTGGIADAAGERSERRDSGLHDRAVGDIGVARHGADLERVAVAADADELADLAQIDERGRRGEALFHRRKERLPAREQFGVLVLEIRERPGDAGGMW